MWHVSSRGGVAVLHYELLYRTLYLTFAAEFRGFLVRRQQLSGVKRRHCAAVKVQSLVRGYLQRLSYQRQIAEHRRKMALLTNGR